MMKISQQELALLVEARQVEGVGKDVDARGGGLLAKGVDA